MRIAILSDIHMIPREGVERFFLYGEVEVNLRVQYNFLASKLKKVNPAPDLIIINGDLTNESDLESYRIIAEGLADFDIPKFAVMGNHDSHLNLHKFFPSPDKSTVLPFFSFDQEQNHFILLDSVSESDDYGNLVEGYIDHDQMKWLKNDLTENKSKRTFIFLHHPPLDVGVEWMDELGLKNKAEFWETISGQDQISKIFFGHLHHYRELNYNGFEVISLPSGSFWFPENKFDGLPDKEPEFLILDIDDTNCTVERVQTSTVGLIKIDDVTKHLKLEN